MNWKKKISFLLTIISLLFINYCKEKDWREELDAINEERNLQIKEDHKLLLKQQVQEFSISYSSKSKEEAIINYLQNLEKDHKSDYSKYSFNKSELRNILYPNTLGYGTVLDNMPLKEYEQLVWGRKILGESMILEKIQGKSLKVKKIEWKQKPFRYGVLMGYTPEIIEISLNGKLKNIKEIKQIIGHNGQFKVAIIAPN